MSSVADGRGWSDAKTAAPAEAAPRGRARLKPLAGLLPYVRRYPGLLVGAAMALLVAALATLAVPLAVRRMIDFGFSAERLGLIDQYFGVMIGVVAVLAGASALRYYLVTVLGERVVGIGFPVQPGPRGLEGNPLVVCVLGTSVHRDIRR